MSTITNIFVEFSDEHMSEAVCFELDGKRHVEPIEATGKDDVWFADNCNLSDNIRDELDAWVLERIEASYESGSEEPEVAEVWHGLFKSNGYEIVLTEEAAKALNIYEGIVEVSFGNGYTVTWKNGSGEYHKVEFFPGSPEANDLGMLWAIKYPAEVALNAVRARTEFLADDAAA